MKWYLAVFKKYATFNGRARRKEYWMFELFNIIVFAILYTLALAVGSLFMVVYTLYALAIIVPSLAVLIRRLHDQEKSGWWIFVSLIPFIGSIWLLVLMCTEGTHGQNSYGPDPKELTE